MLTRTIYNPYAWAIFHNLKHYETIPHYSKIRGIVAIHAAKHVPTLKEVATFYQSLLRGTNDLTLLDRYGPEWLENLPRGVVLGIVDIMDCVPVESIRGQLSRQELIWGDYADGRYALVLDNPVPLDNPIPAKGQQGWCNWDLHLETRINDFSSKIK